jgi:hypothetical protein
MDLHTFPFDFHTVEINIDFQRQGLPIEQAKLILPKTNGAAVDKGALSLNIEYSALVSWEILGVSLVEMSKTYRSTYSGITLFAFIRRHPAGFLSKTVLLVYMATVCAFAALYLDELAERLAHVMTVFVANGALLFVINHQIPSMSYLTSLDDMVIASFLVVFLIGIECCVLGATEQMGWEHEWKLFLGLFVLYTLLPIILFYTPYKRWKAIKRKTMVVASKSASSSKADIELDAKLAACRNHLYLSWQDIDKKKDQFANRWSGGAAAADKAVSFSGLSAEGT